MNLNIDLIVNNINYIGAMILFVIGLYTVLTHPNLIKKVIGLNIMETAIFLFFVSIGYVQGAVAPIVNPETGEQMFVNPLPSAMILTGIVVAISITAFALSLIVKIHAAYGTIELDEIMKIRSVELDD
ncbi:multisubunit sodium/proton antiporter, MrpC subunit [Pelagirhabdus alkalitolerans]|uniref:Multisubunit sodium/proton antiporter, MrpC subunit n=1 Tax=Pelagirhabdus alkalitolerans TaxID=1612202 RepID=A0A1G6H859_9BACI|nr:cation:proton antiporter subunit C [Pelagirhabdus alkalitolerans]SDB90450.1 multisubunit sodium/proton antiporter, MrpC subunit [Pelagirhabdus alkalitolerans]